MIGKFETLFAIAERLIKARPMLSTLAGGILAYMFGFGLPLALKHGFRLRMTEDWLPFLFVLLLAFLSAFFIVFVHWTLARYCEHRPSQVINFLGAMVFPALMFALWTATILFR